MEKLFKIVKDNKKSLREKSKPVLLPLSDEIKNLGLDMLNYLKLSQDENFLKAHPNVRSGVGLAAPQIGKNIQLIAISIEYFNSSNKSIKEDLVLVNPKIIEESAKKCYLSSGEGCLSVDKPHQGYVYRSYKIKVKAFSLLDNKEVEFIATGYKSIVLQHEIDHLNGILFYDRINVFNPFNKLADSIEL